MDEHTLNDLLECSVCLERLDTTSKVLPCQHTFCRKCLQDIVASQNKLRCPECRILVSCKIDELPPNVLLMRILEGMRQNAAAGKIDSKGEESETQPERLKVQPSAETVAPPGNTLLQKQTIQQSQQPARHKQRRFLLPHAYALFDFTSSEATDLKFKKGDLILLKHRIDNNWFVGQANGQEGTFPINYVKVSVPLPMPQCIAMYDFKMGPNDEEGCLEFKKSTVIHVMRRVDHNWAEGRIGQTIGIFPIAFVELNAAAKKLLDSGVNNHPPCHSPHKQGQRALPPVPVIDPTIVTESSSGSTNTTPASSNSSSTSSSNNCSPNHQSSLPNTPHHVVASGSESVRFRDKGAKEKRHSLNALLGGGAPLSLLQTNRHSAEILSLPHELSRLEIANLSAPKPTTASQSSRVLKTNVQQQMPPSLPWGYLALFPYKPRQTDELELKKGCVYIVTERCVDGWFKGKNWLDITGVFPGNYLTPLRTRDQQQLMHQWKYVPHSSEAQQTHTQQQPVAADVRLNNMLPLQPPDLPPRQLQPSATTTSSSVWSKPVEVLFSRKSEPKSEITNASATNSSSSGAVGLMRRLTHMKTRSKSPGALLQQAPKEVISSNMETTSRPAAKLHPVHVRSGSCPSQLQHSQPLKETPITKAAPQQQSFPPKQLPAATNSSASYGSQRVKGNKDRPHLICARQSLDAATFRNMYSNAASPPPPASFVAPAIYAGGQQQAMPGGGPQSQLHANMIIAPSHRKSHSLDAGHVLNPNSNLITEAAIKASATTKSAYCTRESRFRCIVPYPPNSDIELELHLGDIIYVQRKQKNGWYKGTHARTHKTGLFPASFVEPDC
ncbi:E3 ubiquitin-protein ligase SH3RF1 [Drosophila eugracilis]|uniref:E3 ubiquitin-protein ligase SH3RF1 n=1 Tax=Drosophila eugracilis TaxID=29029 RepID=UPI0007E8A947|nr:E3 ubiquitin-protein ligase SH3RF1 [Drosophila eugracilis]XP_017078548.1 E3 ubiquitin-protein ligase SH3RF1 [Drosophila eugracilis]